MNGKTENLISQVDKLFRGNNRKSIKTRYRYLEAAHRFCSWLGENTNLKKFKNIKCKHIYMYVNYLKAKGYSSSYIKTDLSAIRFFYNLTDGKELLPSNSKLNLEKRKFGGIHRAWSIQELERAIELARRMNRIDVVMVLMLGYAFGTRLEEAVTLTTHQIKKSIENKGLYLENTKGNFPREVPVPVEEGLHVLNYILQHSKSKERVFIGVGDSTHKVKRSIQDWIRNHRRKFQDSDRINNSSARKFAKEGIIKKANLTVHGTRHSYAQRSCSKLIESGENPNYAKKCTSEKLGHHRKSVTNIYLASIEK